MKGVALLCLSSWYIATVIVLWLCLTLTWAGLQCEIVVFSDHSQLNVYGYTLYTELKPARPLAIMLISISNPLTILLLRVGYLVTISTLLL